MFFLTTICVRSNPILSRCDINPPSTCHQGLPKHDNFASAWDRTKVSQSRVEGGLWAWIDRCRRGRVEILRENMSTCKPVENDKVNKMIRTCKFIRFGSFWGTYGRQWSHTMGHELPTRSGVAWTLGKSRWASRRLENTWDSQQFQLCPASSKAISIDVPCLDQTCLANKSARLQQQTDTKSEDQKDTVLDVSWNWRMVSTEWWGTHIESSIE